MTGQHRVGVDKAQPGCVPETIPGPFAAAWRNWIAALCLICALCITFDAWSTRFSMNPDGISYLDMAGMLSQGDYSPLAHPYWSSLYPALLAIVLRLIPDPALEFQAAHVANWFIGLAALAAFTFFLRQWMSLQGGGFPGGAHSLRSFRLRTGFAYALFLAGTVDLIGLAIVSPDLLVAALLYLAAGICCRLSGPAGSWGSAVLLGFVLGVSYFAKAAMLPAGAALLLLLLLPGRIVPRRRLLLAASVAFLVTITPLVAALSRQQGRLAFGESGRYNYAKLCQRITGSRVHPSREFSRDPLVVDLRNTVPGTYPLHYNPAYFFEGLEASFDLRKQITATLKSVRALWNVSGSVPLLAGLLVLLCIVLRRRFRPFWPAPWPVLWPLAGIAMYAAVVVEPRYIGGFWVLFWFTAYELLCSGRFRPARTAVTATITICILLPLAWSRAVDGIEQLRAPRSCVEMTTARELEKLGIRAGDEIAIVGDFVRASFVARLARLRIVAQAPDGTSPDASRAVGRFRSLNGGEFESLKAMLRQSGVRAILALDSNCEADFRSGWESAGRPGDCVHFLQ